MSTVRRAARNLGALTVAQVLVRGSGLLITAVLARHLGREGFGLYGLCLTFAGLFGVVTRLGTRQIMLRDVSAEPERGPAYLATAITLQAAQAVLAIALTVVVALVLGYRGTQLIGITIMAFSVSMTAFESLFFAVFESAERMAWEAALVVLRQALWICLALVAVSLHQPYTTFLVALLTTGFVVAVIAAILVHRSFHPVRPRLQRDVAGRILRAGLPLAGAAILVDLYLKSDVVMLDRMVGPEAVGDYNAAYRLIQSLMFVCGAFFTVVFPIFSRLSRDSMEKLQFAYSRSIKAISMVLVPTACVLSILAEPIVTLIFSEAFLGGAVALRVAIWVVAANGLSIVMGRLLLALDRQVIIMRVSIVSLILNVGLNFVLIPRWGPVGAATASLVTGLCVLALNWGALSQLVGRLDLIRLLWPVYAATAVMGGAVWLLRDAFLLWPLLAAAAVYAVVLLMLGGLDQRDRQLLAGIFRRGAPQEG